MAKQGKEPLFVTIVDAAPELDFLFALARRTKVSITFSVDGIERSMDVYIDSLSVGKGERLHPTSQKFSNTWFIMGHFWGDGERSWSTILHKPTEKIEDGRGNPLQLFDDIEVWGSFQGTYHKGKRSGQIQTLNYRRRTTSLIIYPC
jgi:hypothetical protein